MNIEKQIEIYKLKQILEKQENMLESLIYYRDNLYSLSFSVGQKRTTYGRFSREYIREPYVNLVKTIESTRENIEKIKKQITLLESDNLRKI